MDTHLHPARMAEANFDVAVNYHRFADKPHSTHANIVAKHLQFILKHGNFRIRVAIANNPQTGRPLAKLHTRIL